MHVLRVGAQRRQRAQRRATPRALAQTRISHRILGRRSAVRGFRTQRHLAKERSWLSLGGRASGGTAVDRRAAETQRRREKEQGTLSQRPGRSLCALCLLCAPTRVRRAGPTDAVLLFLSSSLRLCASAVKSLFPDGTLKFPARRPIRFRWGRRNPAPCGDR